MTRLTGNEVDPATGGFTTGTADRRTDTLSARPLGATGRWFAPKCCGAAAGPSTEPGTGTLTRPFETTGTAAGGRETVVGPVTEPLIDSVMGPAGATVPAGTLRLAALAWNLSAAELATERIALTADSWSSPDPVIANTGAAVPAVRVSFGYAAARRAAMS